MGLFYADRKPVEDPDQSNRKFPCNAAEVKALFLTHAHVDHNGRLPLLYAHGFRGPIYCTDATLDLTRLMLEMSLGVGESDDKEPLWTKDALEGVLGLFKVVPYNKRVKANGLEVRYTDAGHILGSAMVEVWTDGRKILFGGDMGPDDSPILCKPTQHFGADAVLVESTYGPTPKDEIDYTDFGERVMKVIDGGGSVLIPAFALHKTQCLVYVLNRLRAEGVIKRDVPIYSDSSTAHRCTEVYEKYRQYHDPDALAMAEKGGPILYRGKYREEKQEVTLKTHDAERPEPAIYLCTSGMLDHAAAPKHLHKMAADPRNACFIVGYQAPDSVGDKLLKKQATIGLPWEERKDGKSSRELRSTEIKLQVEKVSGFSSHARGGQILDWLSNFESVGPVFVVHGDKKQSTGLADKAVEMGLDARAPTKGEAFEITSARVKPKPPPKLEAKTPSTLSPVDK